MKLRQLLSGFLKGMDGTIIQYDNPKLKALKEELIDLKERKCSAIIWANFIYDIDMISSQLAQLNMPFVRYYGELNSKTKKSAIKEFQNSKTPIFFVGQPASGGVGLNLSKADTIIWYSYPESSIVFEQANERATAIGKNKVDIIKFKTLDSVEELILGAFKEKKTLADFLSGKGLKDILK
jgi:SNF2 family DNA or RNA helicase